MASTKEIEMGISRLGSPTKATNDELPKSVRTSFCRNLESGGWGYRRGWGQEITTTRRLGEEKTL